MVQKAQNSHVSSNKLTHECLNGQCLCTQIWCGLAGLWTQDPVGYSSGNSIQKRCKVLDSMSSSDNENQHLACIKKAHVLYWEQSHLTEKVQRAYSSASSFLIPSQAFRRFCLTPLWLSHLPEGRHQCQYVCTFCLDKVDTSKPTKLPESRNLLFSPVPLSMVRDFPKLVSPLLFLQLFAKTQKQRELPKIKHFSHFSFPHYKHTYICAQTQLRHLFLISLVRWAVSHR